MTNYQPPSNLPHLKECQQLIESSKTQQTAKKQESEKHRQTEALVDTLWIKMSGMYGHKFMSQFGEIPDNTWVTCLTGITGRQMANGLNACLEQYPDWPPGAAQFRSMCLGRSMGQDGKSLAPRAGMYNTEPTEAIKAKRRTGLESDMFKHKRKKAAEEGLNDLRRLLDED